MDGMAGALIATIVMFSVILRFEAMRRMGERVSAAWREHWHSLSEGERREETRTDFESFKAMSAAGLNAANLAGIVAVSLVVFAGNLFVQPPEAENAARWFRIIFAALILFFGIVPWLAIYWNGTARRAKQYGVFHMGRRGRFLDVGFTAVVLGSFLLAIPALREWMLLIPYFALAGVSAYVFNAWLFFNRPPQEAT